MRAWLVVMGLVLGSCAAPDLCEGRDCGKDGYCVVESGAPLCRCFTNYVREGDRCVRAAEPANDAGFEDAGADAGVPDAGDADAGARCLSETDCSAGERCAAGRCVSELLILHFPDASVEVGVRPRMVEGRVLRADGGSPAGVRLPEQVELSLQNPWLSRPSVGETASIDQQGRFAVSVAALPTAVTTLSTVVHAQAAPAEPAELSVVAIPNGEGSIDLFTSDGGAPIGPRKRDEVLTARVRVPRGIESFESLPLAFQPARSCGCPDGEQDAGQCACFDIELWVPPLLGLTGRFDFELFATDTLGNTTPIRVAVDVTRYRWTTFSSLGHIRSASPVLDDQGGIYVGAFSNPPRGGIVAFRPDGTIKWERDLRTVVHSLALSRGSDPLDAGDDVVFFTDNFYDSNSQPDGGRVAALSVATGDLIPGQCDATSGGGAGPNRLASSLALVPRSTAPGAELAAIARFNSTASEPGSLCEWHPSMGNSAALQPMTGDSIEAATTPLPPPVRPGRAVLVAQATSANAPFQVVYSVTDSSFSHVKTRTLVGTNALGPSSSLAAQPLSWWAPSVGLDFLGGASATSPGSFAMMIGNGGMWRVPQGGVRIANGVSDGVVDRQGRIWFAADGHLMWLDPASNAEGQVLMPQSIGSDVALMLTEDANGSGDRLYGASGSHLFAVRTNPIALDWFAPQQPYATDATYDCNRSASPRARAATGILYAQGLGASLAAIIMDSPHLDRQAIWPKYQRDVFNSANTFLRFDNCP